MRGIGSITGMPELTEGERTERDLLRKMESLSTVSSSLLNLSTSISYALVTRTWTESRRVDMVETLRSLADRLERIDTTEPA